MTLDQKVRLVESLFNQLELETQQFEDKLNSKTMSINKALKIALEEVLQYYTYRPIPSMDRQIG